MPAVFILIAIVVVAVAVVVSNASREELNRSWSTVAHKLDLAFTPSSWNVKPKLEGSVESFPLTVDVHTKSSGKHQSAYTRFRLGLPSLDLGLKLKEQGILSSISKLFGTGDIDVGDARFDDRLLVKGHDSDAVRRFLTASRRGCLQRFYDSHRGATITDREIVWSKQGRISAADKLLATIEAMVVVGRSLTGAEPYAALPEAVAALPADPAVPVDPAAGAEGVAEAERLVEPEPVPEAVVDAPPLPIVPAVDPPRDASGGVAAFCDTVFTPGAMSFEATRVFEDGYKGRHVAWAGTLKAAEPYSFDFAFGPGRGVKATVAIHTVDAGMLGQREVSAVIQLPPEIGDLRSRIGEPVSFSGTLSKVDGLMRKVFLMDGSLNG
jgi:hypothetical protein